MLRPNIPPDGMERKGEAAPAEWAEAHGTALGAGV